MIDIIPDYVPKIDEIFGLMPENIDSIRDLLPSYLSIYKPCFTHDAQFVHFQQYSSGLLSELERKSMEPIALKTHDDRGLKDLPRALQFFMKRSPWSLETMGEIYRRELAGLVSHGDAMLTVDACDNLKKGTMSPGVARMYIGAAGKRDNGQAYVMVGISGARGFGLIDYRLYMPNIWFSDEYKERWDKCGIPDGTVFKTKLELATEMILSIIDEGTFTFRWIGADSWFGHDSKFIDSLPQGFWYFVNVHADDRFFTSRPAVSMPDWRGIGRKPSRLKADGDPVQVDDADVPWAQAVFGIGSWGPIVGEYKLPRVIEAREGLPGKEIWLFARRLADGSVKYSVSNAPDDTPPEKFIGISLRRWPIEQCFAECKFDLGMDHFEGRSWKGWHRHVMIVLVVHLFLHLSRKTFSIDAERLSPMGQELYRIMRPEDDERKAKIFTLGQMRFLINSTFMGDGSIFKRGVRAVMRYVKRNRDSFHCHLRKFHAAYPDLVLHPSG
jgi:SRSO17 transposase